MKMIRPTSSSPGLYNYSNSPTKKTHNLKITTKSAGCILGEQDAMKGMQHATAVRCLSTRAFVLKISA